MDKKHYFNHQPSENKSRVSFWCPNLINERLNADASTYGTTKTDIIISALIQYYKTQERLYKH